MNRKFFFQSLVICLLIVWSAAAYAQDNATYDHPQKAASFPGGYGVFLQYLGNNIKFRDIEVAPAERRVQVLVIIESDGAIGPIMSVQGGNDSLRQEAARIVKASPKWLPAYNDDKPVRSAMGLNILFGKGQLHNAYSDELYTLVDKEPGFHGGAEALDRYIADNLHYPKADLEKGISGTVEVTFIVEKDGSLAHITANGPTEGMKAEAVRLFSASPKWWPGVSEGNKYVRVVHKESISFNAKK